MPPQDSQVSNRPARFPVRPCDRTRRSWLGKIKPPRKGSGSTSHSQATYQRRCGCIRSGDKTDVRRHSRFEEGAAGGGCMDVMPWGSEIFELRDAFESLEEDALTVL